MDVLDLKLSQINSDMKAAWDKIEKLKQQGHTYNPFGMSNMLAEGTSNRPQSSGFGFLSSAFQGPSNTGGFALNTNMGGLFPRKSLGGALSEDGLDQIWKKLQEMKSTVWTQQTWGGQFGLSNINWTPAQDGAIPLPNDF